MRSLFLFMVTVVVGAALDLWTKSLAFEAVPEFYSRPIVVIEGFFSIVHAENDGAMWSLFTGLPRWVWVLVRTTVLFVILGYYLSQRKSLPGFVHFAFGFVLAGAIGNLHDNVFGNGRVRDFLRFVFFGWAFPTFNIADSLICVGACLLLIYFAFIEGRSRARAGEVPAP